MKNERLYEIARFDHAVDALSVELFDRLCRLRQSRGLSTTAELQRDLRKGISDLIRTATIGSDRARKK